jgi:hypothetical protein
MAEFAVEQGDILRHPADLLLVKYAQAFYGADEAAASHLVAAGLCSTNDLQPKPGDYVVVETKNTIPAKRVMFLGVPPLRSFMYAEMELFAKRAIETISDLCLPVRSLITTVHGMGYGLDGGEALQCLVAGFRKRLSRERAAPIEKITFLTLDTRSERMLRAALEGTALRTNRPSESPAARDEPHAQLDFDVQFEAADVVKKRHVFVAMPFAEEFQNVYEFGIYPAVRNCGFICERVDETHFTGDVLERIRVGIQSADLVIADLTEGRPNVYLEVGYAWGRNIPVVFVAKKGEKVHFDVSTHRCVYYGRFSQFAKDLEALIRGLSVGR